MSEAPAVGLAARWRQVSIPTRVLLGAGLAAIIIAGGNKWLLKKQAAAIAKLQAEYRAIETAGVDIAPLLAAKQVETDRIRKNVAAIKEKNDRLAAAGGSLERGHAGAVVAAFRGLLDKHGLRLVNEERCTDAAAKAGGNNGRYGARAESGREKTFAHMPAPQFPGMKTESYRFTVLGRFADILDFLRTAYASPQVYFLNNIMIKTSAETLIDKNYQQHAARECAFELHIPYLDSLYGWRPGGGKGQP